MALTQISTAGVKDDAVTAGKIPANAVGSSELADNAVDTAAIADDAVNNDKIANSAVNTAQLADSAVHTQKINDDAITTDKLANSIVNDINANTAKNTNATHTGDVTGSGSLTIASNAVTTAKIADDAVTLAKFQDLPVNTLLGRVSSGSGTLEELTAANVRSIINVADGATAGAGTTINNNADNRVITGSGTANTLEGEVNLKYDGTLKLNGLTNTAGQNSDALTVNRADGLQLFGINWNVSANDVSFSGNTKNYVFKNKSGSAESIRFPSTGGITFNGDTAAANALDDYEEGTFTPEFNSGSAASACYASGVSYSSQVGVYRKVGNVVHFIVKIQVSSGTLKSGVLQINNLPFTSGDFSSYSIVGGAFLSYTTGYFSDTANIPTIFVAPGATAMQFYNTAGNNFAGSHLAQAAGRLDINGHYFTS